MLPLKIGIHKDILTALPGISRNDLKRMLGSYVRDLRYRRALVEGGQRVDLDGRPAGEVSESRASASEAAPAVSEAAPAISSLEIRP